MTGALLITDPVERRRALTAQDALTPISGCAECGRIESDHEGSGHGWDFPTPRLRQARLDARKEMAGAR